MSSVNTKPEVLRTHEGAPAKRISPLQQLRRSVMSCMLWEDEFYEDGESIAKRIANHVAACKPEDVAAVAIEVRTKGKLRHVPLLIASVMAGIETHKRYVARVLEAIIQRADELAEFLAIYWSQNPKRKNGKNASLSGQVKRGLAAAFTRFTEYALAKYNRDNAIKLRDVLFLSHPKPKDAEQAAMWKRLIDGKLETPDTWEVELSSGEDKKSDEDKKAKWERLLREKKLGALALLRNLRNMLEAKVENGLIKAALSDMDVRRVLPFRFISAARYAPKLEPELEGALFRAIKEKEKLPGRTILLIDVSGSMDERLSRKSEITRLDAACGVAIIARELCEDVDIGTFSNMLFPVPPRRGFALRDAIVHSQSHGGTNLGVAIKVVNNINKYDRIIVVTDEQSRDSVPNPHGRGYMINVASARNGVGYGQWIHIDGFSESTIEFICEYEKEYAQSAA